jgi:hypothetical protein
MKLNLSLLDANEPVVLVIHFLQFSRPKYLNTLKDGTDDAHDDLRFNSHAER